MLDTLQAIEQKYLNLREQAMDPTCLSDTQKMIAINKELTQLQELYDLIQLYKQTTHRIQEAKDILEHEHDPDLISMAKEELKDAEPKLEQLEHQIKIALLPKDPNDDKNIYLEIRPAAGGDEAGLFAAELLKMYLGYAAKK